MANNITKSEDSVKLVLKKVWFDKIAYDGKREEYREIKPYYCSKFLLVGGEHRTSSWWKRKQSSYPSGVTGKNFYQYIIENIDTGKFTFKKKGNFTFYLGYQKNRPSIHGSIYCININTGNPEWGAEEGKFYFVLKIFTTVMLGDKVLIESESGIKSTFEVTKVDEKSFYVGGTANGFWVDTDTLDPYPTNQYLISKTRSR